jgi:hypothetical protein
MPQGRASEPLAFAISAMIVFFPDSSADLIHPRSFRCKELQKRAN